MIDADGCGVDYEVVNFKEILLIHILKSYLTTYKFLYEIIVIYRYVRKLWEKSQFNHIKEYFRSIVLIKISECLTLDQ